MVYQLKGYTAHELSKELLHLKSKLPIAFYRNDSQLLNFWIIVCRAELTGI